MSTIHISELFENERFPKGLDVVLLLFYFPIGLVLSVLRLFIGFHAFLVACLLPKLSVTRSVVIRTMCGILGIYVTLKDSMNRKKSVKVMVANYTSTLDHLAVDLVIPNILPCVWDLPPTLMWMLGYSDLGANQGREVLIENTKKHCSKSDLPVLVFPEGASTNGKKGLLKFSGWPFTVASEIQPVLITLHRPMLAKLAPSILGGRWWIDMFWFMFVPYTVFKVRILPAVDKEECESIEDFTVRVQKLMASALNIAATVHTSADKVEYAKRKLLESSQRRTSSDTRSNNNRPELFTTASPSSSQDEVSRMAYQVKEVLPHVPIRAIIQDLALTKDVDLTISNILEGKVEFVAEEDNSTSRSSSPPTPQHSTSPAKSSVAADSFSKVPKERHLSLAERKQNLLATARQKYIEKHGLK